MNKIEEEMCIKGNWEGFRMMSKNHFNLKQIPVEMTIYSLRPSRWSTSSPISNRIKKALLRPFRQRRLA